MPAPKAVVLTVIEMTSDLDLDPLAPIQGGRPYDLAIVTPIIMPGDDTAADGSGVVVGGFRHGTLSAEVFRAQTLAVPSLYTCQYLSPVFWACPAGGFIHTFVVMGGYGISR